MNTNQLKKFAQQTRRKLMEQVSSKLEYVLNTDSPELREKSEQVQKLKEILTKSSKEEVVDRVSYTWFNRLMALRFMDVNDYQPIGTKVITPNGGYTLPEILDEAKRGHISDDLNLNRQKIYDILDGKIPSSNPQNEAYKELLIASCNHLSSVFPFLFERINDYTELLLPDDLTSELSIIQDVRDGMSAEDCKEVEIIGWLYQFYISEKKDELINAKKVYKADEIAPVTQLFTPKWIVEYMVDNTLGQYWKEARPSTNILNNLQFYIKPNDPTLIPLRNVKSPEDIKFFDPCVGSAHILSYAFDILFKIYEEEGYEPSIISELIISKNLYGIDIDDRAAQLANFTLMMKGRKHSRRFFKKNIIPNITAFQNVDSNPKFENAKVLGSLIKINKEEADKIEVDESSLFGGQQKVIKAQATMLSDKYDIIVTNPPYLNSSYMNGELRKYVENNYNDTKSDLFACFLKQCINFTKNDGLLGFICPYVWMFIQSYEKLRKHVIGNTTIGSLVQLEYNAFGPAVVPICSFVLRNGFIDGFKGSYIKLSEFRGEENQAPRTLQAIKDKNCNWIYQFNQNSFNAIPDSVMAFWLSASFLQILDTVPKLETISSVRQGMATSDNNRFLRLWFEVPNESFGRELESRDQAVLSKLKWFPYNKGGEYRKWFGNLDFVVNWEADGKEIKEFRNYKNSVLSSNMGVAGMPFIFKENITWSKVTAGKFSVRYLPKGFLFDVSGCAIYSDHDINIKLLSLLNSKAITEYIKNISPTMNYEVGHIKNLPISTLDFDVTISSECIKVSMLEWNSREYSWEFLENELLRLKGHDLEESYDLYQQYWKNKFFQLHKNEEELNKQFIEIYGLQDELTPHVPLEDITILKEETSILNDQLVFNKTEVFAQFLSYAVGCMFGRYSLDKEGLILANQGETLVDYLTKIGKEDSGFLPDEDNIIPILDDEWFEDDIVGRFHHFLKASFGKENFDKNLAFVEECLGKDIRKYFVKDFYNDHIKRYKKRPIYWMFSSPKGSFNVLIYMHRYTQDTLNKILNDYLIQYREKLNTRIEHLQHIKDTGSSTEQIRAEKEITRLKLIILELVDYERDIFRPLAIDRIKMDLDDGVLVNYNKFGKAIKEVAGLNDTKTKKKVKEFDWIKTEEIR